MRNKTIASLTNFIGNLRGIHENSVEYQKIKYEVSVFVYDSWKYAVLLLISIFLGVTKEIVAMSIGMNLIRRHSSGFHLKNGISCLLLGLATFLLPTLIFKNATFSVTTLSIIAISSIAIFYRYAPIPTINRPISKVNTNKNKIKAIFTVTILFAISLFFDGFVRNMLATSMMICAISTLPIMYRLAKNELCDYRDASYDSSTIITLFQPMNLKKSMKQFKENLAAKIISLQTLVNTKITSKHLQIVMGVFVFCFAILAYSVPTLAAEIKPFCAPPSWFEEPEMPKCLKDQL